MGKKQGEAARVKGNAKPSSSAKAAEMLTKVPNYSFGSDISSIGKGTFLDDSFDSNVDPDFRMVLKKLTKKDTLTKTKTLDELKNLIDTKSEDDCVNIVSYWAKFYTKLSIDNDRKIRELCQQNHEKLCIKVNKNLAPHIKTIMPYWLMAQCDSYFAAAKIAENSFKFMFNENKQPEVIYFCRDEILNTLQDFLLVQTAKTLSDMKNTSEDEAVQKYENILTMAMRAFSLYLSYLFTDNSKIYQSFNWTSLEKILLEPKFLKYSKEVNQKTRSNFFYLLSFVIEIILLNKNLIVKENNEDFKFRKNLESKLIPLVFYALDEDNELSCQFVWKSILKCLTCSDILDATNFWSLINVKKTFMPKLMSVLRNHGNGTANQLNISTICPCLSQLLSKLRPTFDSDDEKLVFYKEFLSKINQLCSRQLSTIPKIRFTDADVIRTAIIKAYFESLFVILDDLKTQSDQGFKFFEEISSQIISIYGLYLTYPIQTTGFEIIFNQFLNKIDDLSCEKFISCLNDLLVTKLKSEQSLDKQLSVLKKYLVLDLKNSQILKWMFKFFLDNIEDCLPIINYLVSNYYENQYLDLIIENEPEKHSIEKYFQNLFSKSSNLVEKAIFYTQMSKKLNKQETLVSELDNLIFSHDRSQESIENFMQQLIHDILNDKLCEQLSSLFIQWIKSSDKIKNFIDEFLLKNLETNSIIISELNSILRDKQFSVLILEIIYKYLTKSNEVNDKLIDLNMSLLDVDFPEKFNLLWNILIEYFRLKLTKNLTNDHINKIINKLINFLITENSLDQFKKLVLVKLDDNDDLIVKIVEKILVEIQDSWDNKLVKNFYQSILLNDELKFEKIYSKFLNNSDLMAKLYLDNRYNYLFKENHSQLIKCTKSDNEWLSNSDLNKITYSISLLEIGISTEINILHPNWYFLLLSSILIDKYYNGSKNITIFGKKIKILFQEKKFVDFLMENLSNCEHFVENNFKSSSFVFDLNNLSLFLMFLIDLKCNSNVELLIKNLMVKLMQKYPEEEENIKLFLMDIPFAKQSILDNIDQLTDNMDHFYSLYESVLQELTIKLQNLTHSLKILNKDQNVSLLEYNLKNFSFILNILVKYVQVYFDLLKDKKSLDFIFKNEKTLEFIRTKLSDYMKKVLDLIISLKMSINENLEFLVKNLSLDELGSGYFFYFNFSTEPKTDLNWEKLNMGIEINSFIGLFFDECVKLSSQLSNNQWDFLLCYSSAMSQRLKIQMIEQSDKLYLQLASISFYQLLHKIAHYLNHRIVDGQIRTDWTEFFSKEVMDPVLVAFINLAQSSSQTNIGNILLNKISTLMEDMSYERILDNQLEPRFNVMDLDVLFDDKIKTIFNHAAPFLKHRLAPIQLGAYNLLKVFMLNIDNYFSEDSSSQIIESLPYVFKETFFQLNDLFSDLKKTFEFEQSILSNDKNITAQTNNQIMSFLLINKLILDMFSSNNLQFKSKLATNLRELNFSDCLMNCLFRLMGKNGSEKFSKLEEYAADLEDIQEYFENAFVESFACRLYKQALKMCPAMIRDWWNMQPKRVSDQVDKFTTKNVSPILIDEEIKQVNRSANEFNSESGSEDESTIKIKGMTSTREIVSTYKMKELSMDLLIQLPLNYPLGVVSVSSAKRLGVSENEWRNWLLQLTTYLTHQNGSIIQGLQIWKRNVDKKFAGVEECTICYSVIHGTNYQLPKMKCRTCKHMFHSVCLYKWFESSSKSSCPLCRNLF